MPNEEPLLNRDEEQLGEANCMDSPGIDPNGPPQPAKESRPIRKAVAAIGCVTVGGILFSMCGVFEGRTMGATRSAKLKWEERDRQIEAAFQKDQRADGDVHSTPASGQDAVNE